MVLVDEAGMVGTYAMRKLAEWVERNHATLCLIGDPFQLPAIGSTAPLLALYKRYGGVALTENTRQKQAWAQKAARNFSQGKVGEALALFVKNRRVIVRDDLDAALEQACLDWKKTGLQAPHRAVVLANTNEFVEKANRLCQEYRLKEGCIEPSPSIAITDEQDAATYQARAYVGDRVRFTRNSRRKYGVENGSLGTIKKIHRLSPRMDVWLDSKTLVTVDVKDFPHIRLGYALTTNAAQGASIPIVHAVVGTGGDLQNLPSSYVQASRAIDDTWLYTTKDLLDPSFTNVANSLLAQQMSKKPDLRLAIEIMQEAKIAMPPDLRLRRLAASAIRNPKQMAYLKVVGMPQWFWVVTAPTPNSRLSDICFPSNFKMLAAYLRGESGTAPRRILGICAAKSDAVAAGRKILEAPCRPISPDPALAVVGMPSSFWMVRNRRRDR